jgi:PAS domain S-box-containing protein
MMAQIKDSVIFKHVFDYGSEAVGLLDSHSKIVMANPSFLSLFGYAPNSMAGRKLVDHLAKADGKMLLDQLRRQAGDATNELVGYKKDGSPMPLKLRLVSLPQKEQPMALVFVNRADNASPGIPMVGKSAGHALPVQTSLDIRNRALNAAGNGILIVDALDPEMPIIFSNPAFSHMTGYRNSEVLGRNCRFLQNGDRDQPALKRLRKAIKKGSECKVVLRNYRKDGTLFWNELTITPVYDQEQNLTHFIGVQHDVTKEKKALQLKDDIRNILEKIAIDQPLKVIAKHIVRAAEAHFQGCMAGIMVLDPKKGTLHQLAAPSLPKALSKALEGMPVGPLGCSCGVSAYSKREVFVPDIAIDPFWKAYHETALANNLKSCWSMPIISKNQEVLGTFSMYCESPKIPLKAYREIMADLSQLAALAIHQNRTGIELEASQRKIEKYTQNLEDQVRARTGELYETVRQLKESNLKLENQIRETQIAEDKAQRSQALFSAIAQNFPKGIIVVFDDSMAMVYVEGEELERLHLKKEDLEGKHLGKVAQFSKIQTENIQALIKQTLAGKHITAEIEYKGQVYSINSTPLRSDKDEIIWALFVYHNITDQKLVQDELLKALISERELNELKSRFISMASHEFRTPLSAILSSAILIGKQNEPGKEERREKHVDRIKANVKNLVVILNDFLSLSKLEEGKVQPKPEFFDISSYIKSLMEEMEINKKEGQRLVLKTSADPIITCSDKKMLGHMINNLLSNAIKYSNEDQEITCLVSSERGRVKIEVIDRGIGIPEAEQKNLFDRFFRAANAANIQGTGLGLHIVKQYIDLVGGTIDFKSEVGKGSTFSIEIPLNLKEDAKSTAY